MTPQYRVEAERAILERPQDHAGEDLRVTRTALEAEEQREIQRIKHKLAEETRVVAQRLKHLQSDEQRELADLRANVQANLRRIDADLAALISLQAEVTHARLDTLRAASIAAYLEQHSILTDRIYGLSSALRTDLYIRGFRTARDIDHAGVSRVRGIGEIPAARMLVRWSTTTLAAADAQAPTSLRERTAGHRAHICAEAQELTG